MTEVSDLKALAKQATAQNALVAETLEALTLAIEDMEQPPADGDVRLARGPLGLARSARTVRRPATPLVVTDLHAARRLGHAAY